ncbi:hypothetical protein ACUR5C_08255 [Aliikangiella sp. IMCC44653]
MGSENDINKTLRTLVMWGLTLVEISRVLSLPEKTINIQDLTCETNFFTDDQRKRIDLVNDIQSFIDNIFSNPENRKKFMTFKNGNKPFNGESPASYIKTGQLDCLIQTRNAIINAGAW